MSRRTIIVIASLLAVLAAAAPLVGIAIYSKIRASRMETQHLGEYAGWTLQRTENNLAYAKDAIARLERERFTDCSPAHIARMRQLSLENRSADEIGFFIGGQLRCTSWGMVTRSIPIGQPDVRLEGGYGLNLNVRPKLTGGLPMHALSHGQYNILMLPSRLVDVMTDTDMTLGIATRDGTLLSISGRIDPALLRHILARSDAGQPARAGRLGQHLYASVDGDDLRAFAISDAALIDQRADGELWVLVPIGLATSALLVALVLWASRQRLSPQKELAIAVRRREFIVLYQPIIALSSGLCVGAEALMRWKRPDGALVAPDLFIPLAEQTGLIEPLTDLVIERVVADLAQMLSDDRAVHVAINISAADMQSGRFLAVLAEALAAAGIAPSQIWLEATERGFMNAAAARDTMERARAAGHLVAIDDFGTGYSNLSLLENLPLDTLKIDKSFIDAIGTEAATSVVIPHIIEMGHGLNFKIVAEGVETEQQEAYLRQAGVEYAQGWRYSPALPADEFRRFHVRVNGEGGRTETPPAPPTPRRRRTDRPAAADAGD